MWGREDTFHEVEGIVNPMCASNAEGRRLRIAMANGEMDEVADMIPEQAKPFFKHAKRLTSPQKYGNIFTTPIPLARLQSYASGKAKNRAPSESLIRIDHFCGAAGPEQKAMGLLMSIPYLTTLTYSSWNTEIINWIPKELGNPALDRRRPIALLEVFRKMSLGAKKQQVFDVWDKEKLIQKYNCAFMKGKAISDAILIKRMALEDAEAFNKTMVALDIDYKQRST